MVANFIHLRVHSAYSLSAGAIKIKDLAKLCKRHQMPAIAVTDTGNLFGALEFSMALSAEGIQPIVGCEFGIRAPIAEGRCGLSRPNPLAPEPEPIVLLCQNQQGYDNLIALVSRSYMDTDGNEAAQLSLEALAGSTDGIICLTGGATGPIGRRLLENDRNAAETTLLLLKSLFPGRLYVEVQRHGMADEDRTEDLTIELAYRHELPLIATNNAFFAEAALHEAHDVLLCIAQGATINVTDRKRLTEEHYFKSAEEMRVLFADLPEACDNTLAVAKRCAFFVKKIKPILPPFHTPKGEVEELRSMAHEGLTGRLERQVFPLLGPDQERAETEKRYRDRLNFELKTIIEMGFPGYFLIVADFIQWAKRQSIPVGPGRGSGAGSVCAWALQITDLDPIPLNLLFERFLNPERVSMPDFDIDFCQDRRGEVLRYVQQKYGRDRVAQIITFGKLQARAVLRDVGRVLAMPFGQVDRICKLVPNNPANPVTLQQAIDADEQLRASRDGDEAVARLMTIALKLEGLYRHASTHAAGVVIGDRPLERLVPLYRDPRSDMPVTQFNMKYVEDAGLVKFDFLGLKTLTVIELTVRLVNQRPEMKAERLDLLTIPLDDKRTFDMLARGDSVGVFQLEGAGMRDMLKKLRADCFEDIIATVALYRPGPMENIPHYIAVKHGLAKADYLHPALEGILKETHGIMIYQEQVMQIAQVLSGYSLGSADLLRRAMGKKIKAEMDAQRKMFVDGAKAKGVGSHTADHIFDRVAKFAGYGFNKSHAAAYALVAYQTGYLKANYPVEFLVASMSLDMGNTDKLNVFRQDIARQELRLLPPDINRSDVAFTVEAKGQDRCVRYALAAVKGVGTAAMEAIVAERDKSGPFRDLFDFAERIDGRQFNRRQFENLVKAGAFDSLNLNRAQTLAAADFILRHAAVAAEERSSAQIGMFGSAAANGFGSKRPNLPKVADWLPMERLSYEFEAIGFYLSAHPLDPYQAAMKRLEITPSSQLVDRIKKSAPGRIRLAGIVTAKKERTSAKGSRFAFVAMSDLSGSFEVTVFSEQLAQARPLIESGQPLIVSVDARAEGDEVPRLTVQTIDLLDTAAARASEGLRIRIADSDVLDLLGDVLKKDMSEARGRGSLKLLLPAGDNDVEISLPGTYPLEAKFRNALTAIPGVLELQDF